jgi:hypothetical protein
MMTGLAGLTVKEMSSRTGFHVEGDGDVFEDDDWLADTGGGSVV